MMAMSLLSQQTYRSLMLGFSPLAVSPTSCKVPESLSNQGFGARKSHFRRSFGSDTYLQDRGRGRVPHFASW